MIDKLTTSLEDHYKTKLISVANGRFEGIYGRRFKGVSKKNVEGCGFQLPRPEKQLQMVERLRQINQNSYYIPSSTDESKTYFVDMNLCTCECEIGQSGAPCKHQYVIWVHVLKKSNIFLPYLSADDRKEYSFLAIGEYLPQSYYIGLHDEATGFNQTLDNTDDINVEIKHQCHDQSKVAKPIQIKTFGRSTYLL